MGTGAVVLCTWFGETPAVPEEAQAALTVGRQAAEALGSELAWLILGSAPADCDAVAAEQGVARVHHVDADLTGDHPDGLVHAAAGFCEANAPRLLLFCQNFESRVVAPRLAGRIGAGVVMNGVAIDASDSSAVRVTASAYGGDTRVVYEFVGDGTRIVSIQANAALPEPAASPSTPERSAFDVDLSGTTERIRITDAAESEGPRLEEAEIIVSGGRGLGSQDNYELIQELAEALGGMAGASRPLVDEGWTDASHQVGLTGRITRPALYLAAGISGASQHMAGCGGAKAIAAINKDPDAAIFRYARYGIVGDCLEILPELIRAAQQTR